MEVKDKPTEKSVLKAVANYFSNGYEYCLKNSFVFRYDWECDFFCVNKEGYSFEVEAKISKADYRNDKKKEKHQLFLDNPKDRMIPNRFYYAVPTGMIKVEDLPPYAGLIYVDGSHATIIKRAPFIHRKKHDFRKVLCDKFYYNWLKVKRELNLVSYKKEEIEMRIGTLNIRRFKTNDGDDTKLWRAMSVDFETRTVTGESEPNWKQRYKVGDDTEFKGERKTFKISEVTFL